MDAKGAAPANRQLLRVDTGLPSERAVNGTLKAGEPVRSVRITPVGQAARDFKTHDEAFKKLMEPKRSQRQSALEGSLNPPAPVRLQGTTACHPAARRGS
jgi:hypothetical protein